MLDHKGSLTPNYAEMDLLFKILLFNAMPYGISRNIITLHSNVNANGRMKNNNNATETNNRQFKQNYPESTTEIQA